MNIAFQTQVAQRARADVTNFDSLITKKLQLKKGMDPLTEELHRACEQQDQIAFDLALEKKANPNAKGRLDFSPIHLVAMKVRTFSVKLS